MDGSMGAQVKVQTTATQDMMPRACFAAQGARARWNGVEAIMMFGWSGSAVLGGFLIDAYGFRITFLITAAMQLVALFFLFALLPVVSP